MTPSGRFLLPLRGRIKTYAWGSRTALAAMTGRPTPSPEPEAELWVGAHPRGAAEVELDGSWVPLRDAIARQPARLMGASTIERFGVEPSFLLKVLAIAQPLSLQVHPDLAQAAAGFERERRAGVALEDGNYRDPRPKPELVVALEPTWILHGLAEPEEIRRRFADAGIGSFAAETARLESRGREGLDAFLASLLRVAGERKRRVLEEARRTALIVGAELVSAPRGEQASCSPTPEPARDTPRFWLRRLLDLYPEDPAALAPLFLHLVKLEPGQGVFSAPGVLHCYLEGAGVEVMASSDNVVRAGLTVKPIDVAEVLAVASTTPAPPATIEPRPVSPGTARYPTAAAEFELWRMEATPAATSSLAEQSALVLGICTRGAGRLEAPSRGEALELRSGVAFAVRPGAGALRLAGDLCAYAATTP